MVTYNANGGSTTGNVPVDTTHYELVSSATVLGNTGNLAKKGYSFIGWSTTADGSGTSYTQGATFVIIADVTLYAKWSLKPTYTVTYDANGGSTTGNVPVDTTHYESGSSVTVFGNTGNLAKTGYIFSNWNSNPNGSGTSYFAGKAIPIANVDIALYAQWIDAHNVSSVNFTNIGTASSPVYSIIKNGTPTGDIVIPSGYNGYPITAIGSSAFSGCSGITSITIPNSVTSIGREAFSDCSGLTSITIPNNVTSIGSYAFSGCSKITSISIPNSVTSISGFAFYDCSGLTSISIPNSVTSIEDRVFFNCSGLASITIPDSVTSIGDYSFCGCSGLASITIPDSVTSIGECAFGSCSKLLSITVDLENPNYKSIPGLLLSKDGTTIIAVPCGLTDITIPNSVTSIGVRAFDGCRKLTSITIPNSVTSIREHAFSGCSGMTSVTIPNSVTSISNLSFIGCNGLASITIPNSVTSIGNESFEGCKGLMSVTIPDSVTSIGGYAFRSCSVLTSITMKSATPPSIGTNAFDLIGSNAIFHVPSGTVSKYTDAGYGAYGTVVTP